MDKPLTCQQIQQIIDEMSAAQLRDSQQHGLVHEHARQCPACRDYLTEALALADHLDQWEVPQPRRNVAASVMGRIAQRERNRPRSAPGPWNHVTALLGYRVRVPMAAMIPILAAMAISVALNLSSARRPVSPQIALQGQPSPSIRPVSTQAPGLPVAQPQVMVVGSPDNQAIRSILARPDVMPSALIVILGTPPGIAWQPGSKPAQTTANQDPL